MGSVLLLLSPMFRTRLIQLRRAQKLTQQVLADETGLHVNQIRRYEAGTNEPTLEVLVRLAKTLHVSLDALVFDEGERGPSEDLALQFEALNHMPEAERYIVKAVLDSLILTYQARRWTAPIPDQSLGHASAEQPLQHP